MESFFLKEMNPGIATAMGLAKADAPDEWALPPLAEKDRAQLKKRYDKLIERANRDERREAADLPESLKKFHTPPSRKFLAPSSSEASSMRAAAGRLRSSSEEAIVPPRRSWR